MKKTIFFLAIIFLVGISAFAMDSNFIEVEFYTSPDTAIAYFRVSAATIGAASTEWWEAEVWQNGELVSEESCYRRNSVPSHSRSIGWWQLVGVDVTDFVINGPFTIVIRSQLKEDKYWSFEVLGSQTAIKTVVEVEIIEKEVNF